LPSRIVCVDAAFAYGIAHVHKLFKDDSVVAKLWIPTYYTFPSAAKVAAETKSNAIFYTTLRRIFSTLQLLRFQIPSISLEEHAFAQSAVN